ncbi:MAG TPA: lipocalin family protein [Casimicrobiaceae bacterium]|nr:lipocalin family protein [Casimicrobiaceae bacterium]
MPRTPRSLLLAALIALGGCATQAPAPMPTVPHVDLERFMGRWYVIASIATPIERGAHNAVESYRLAGDGSIETTFTFNADAFDGPERRYRPRGFVLDPASNAHWGMQFVWPIRADYRIVYLTPDYSQTVIARAARDYVWVMARDPEIPDPDYRRIVALVGSLGYDPGLLRKVPQRWPLPSQPPVAPASKG